MTCTGVSGGGLLLTPIPGQETNDDFDEVTEAAELLGLAVTEKPGGAYLLTPMPDATPEKGNCWRCHKPLKEGQYFSHDSCEWINDHQLLLLFGIIAGTVWWCGYLL